MSSNTPVVELHRKALIKAQAIIWKKPSCKFVVTTLVYGISQWSTRAQVQWSGPIPGPGDKIEPLAFMAFQEQQVIRQDQATRGEVKQKMVRGKHVILHHLLESRGYGHPSCMEGTPGEITVAI